MAKPTIQDRVAELVEIAAAYAADGAFLTAALRLRQAADIYDTVAARQNGVAGRKAAK